MNRLKRLLEQSTNRGEKLLSAFVTAGYPELHGTADLVVALDQAGADFIELGIPFSDPIADGPTIQAASYQALQNGMNLKLLLEQVQEIRRRTDIPLLLMGYFNPLHHFGLETLVDQVESAGADGFIIPDLLPEDYGRFSGAFRGHDIGVNFLVSPNTRAERMSTVDSLTDSFVYCVSVTGVTGARTGVPAGIVDFLRDVRQRIRHPALVGFGISTGADAAAIATHCDGVIVGSAIIKALTEKAAGAGKYAAACGLVREIKDALTGVSNGN